MITPAGTCDCGITVAVESPRTPFPPFPQGWYAVAFTSELRPRQVVRRSFVGKQAVLWRAASGRAHMMGAYCPHMGAHLGYGGTVTGETIVCPFHGFRFADNGRCVATGYGTEPPDMSLATLPIREQNGLIMAYHDPSGAAPAWHVPDLDTDGWTGIHGHCIPSIDSHPQEITESSVDLGHFSAVQRYRDIRLLADPRTDGPYFYTRYGMTRKGVIAGLGEFRSEFDVHVHGLGFSLVEAEVSSMGLRARIFILPVPVDSQKIDLRLGASVRSPERRVLRAMPRAAWAKLVLRGLVHDVMEDYEVWNNKVYMQQPRLAKGDGPVGAYRRWARRFYLSATVGDAGAPGRRPGQGSEPGSEPGCEPG